MKQELVEICLRVRNIDATLDFYTNLFDFEVASRREFPEKKFDLVYLNSPGSSVQIELTYNYDAEPYNVGNGFSHLGVAVGDLEKMYEICTASTYETGELRGLSGGTPTYFFVTDPDGYRIEVKRAK
ncbi:lactoylglutathione lyase [Carnobacterium iners]|uniref:Aldoketomutase n=1 Tax=Carnobacterium iners TaxID=1073423 RepID=A0A1X7MTB4_9LACT|nr:VOC family protein [Carnobacterium iners]SEK75364.1 lactoylglutathione lyase [Carnobacterium iners]SMH27377.1 lactoylglutathione lyase [Carnobacterium iners]